MIILYNYEGVLLLRSDSNDVAQAVLQGVRVERYLVDVALWDLYSLRVERRSDGSPYLLDNKRYISISHTKDTVAIMISDSRCGIDIEHKSRDAKRVALKFTSENEVMITSNLCPKNPHLLIWCAKEALYKMCGVAGAEFCTDFEIVASSEDRITCIAFGNKIELRFFESNDFLVVHS